MKQFFEVLKLIPAIVEAMKTVESIIPLPGQGNAKLQFVIGVISDLVGDVSPLIEPITKIISRLTTLFNSTGQFTKGGQAQ